MDKKSEITFCGLTSFRNENKRFGIKTDDRRRHFYLIGKTGVGKSNMMENMAIQDVQLGRGVAYVDPHGEGADKILEFVPSNRINDVIYFNPSDLDYPIAFNVMEKVDFRYRHLVASGLMGVFKKVWPDVWSARMEYILNNTILALLEYPDATLLGVNRMLADVEYRKKVVDKITDPIVKSFWTTEYARYTQKYEIEATAAIQNKVGQFISNPLIRNIIGQTKSTINMREIMDGQKILIMNLSKGKIGEDNSKLLGALLITKLQLAAMSRVDIPEDDRKDIYLYVDEFQNYATDSFAGILSEARKYRLNLIMAHQYITQMEETVRDAVFGNVGTMAVFRVGAEDAEFLEKEFAPEFTAQDLSNLPKYNIYIKLMIDGIASHPFSARTLPPPVLEGETNKYKIIKASQERYGVRREIVDEKISRWSGFLEDKLEAIIPKATISIPEKKPEGETPTTLYDVICSMCGKSTKVIFEPEEGRPIYCKTCLKKIKSTGDKGQPKPASKPAQVPPQAQKSASVQSPAQAPKPEIKQPKPAQPVVNQPRREEPRKENIQPKSQIEQKSNQERRQEQKPEKIENISFHGQKKMAPDHDQKHHRKEINLSELKKALEQSLEIKEKEIKEAKVENTVKEVLQNTKVEEKKIEEPRKETLVTEEQKPIVLLPPAEEKKVAEEEDQDKKGVIKPGQTVKF